MNIELSIVVPAYCEQSNVEPFLDAVHGELSKLNLTYEVILIDDGSTDKTWDKIIDYAEVQSKVRGIRLSRNFGKEAAITAGIDASLGQAVITMDIDLQHPIYILPKMIHEWLENGYQVVEVVKETRQSESYIVSLLSKMFYLLFYVLSGIQIRGATDYKLLDREVIESWSRMKERRLFFRGTISWLGYEAKKIYFTPDDRIIGESKWSLIKLAIYATHNISKFSSKPLIIAFIISILYFVFALILGGHVVIAEISGDSAEGFATVYLIQLITGGLLFFCLSLISSYIDNIYNEVKRRPRYIVSSKINKRCKSRSIL